MFKFLPYLLLIVSFHVHSADFDLFFPHLIRVEGTFFTVTQYDTGGATKFGVTNAVYQTWCHGKIIKIIPCDKDLDGKITSNDLRLTVLRDVKPLYKTQYWDMCQADLIKNQAVAELLVDMIVHCGTGYHQQHVKALQRMVGAVPDGKIGPKTLRAINRGNSSKIYTDLSKYRKSFYKKLTLKKRSQRKFLKGWYKRLFILKQIHFSHEKVTKISPFGLFRVVPTDRKFVYGCYRKTTQSCGFIGQANDWPFRF